MKIQPNTLEDAMDIIYNILNQGDSRYNDSEEERILSNFILSEAIILEEKNFPYMEGPNKEDLSKHFIQGQEKYLAKNLLNLYGFETHEIFFERRFLGFRPDVFAEKGGLKIIVECCSCKISKIINFLSEVNEIWILTQGENLWEKNPLFEKMQWFIFKKGPCWEKIYNTFRKKQNEELKKIQSPIDSL